MRLLLAISLCFLFQGKNSFAQESGFYKEMTMFSEVMNHVRTNYVDEVQPSKIIEGAIGGLLSSLDPHTTYLDSLEFAKFNEITEGRSFGTGIEIEIIHGTPTVISILEGSPAEKTRIRPGDVLISVDNKSVFDLSEQDIQLLLAGDRGTETKLTLRSRGDDADYQLTMNREEIPLHSVPYWFMMDKVTGYVRISRFSITTDKEFFDAVRELRGKNMKNLIIDLRNNPGGVVKSAEKILDAFAQSGEKLFEFKGRKEETNKAFLATDGAKLDVYPVIVLINHSSASAAELLAGGLQDFDRALVVGTTSFGKGLVQNVFLLKNGGSVLMTIARYYTPSGRLIQRDYKGKKQYDYYNEIFSSDTLSNEGKPSFKTKTGRTVYGGGGISPDIVLRNPALSFSLHEFIVNPVTFEFINNIYTSRRKELDNFDVFKKQFNFSSETIHIFFERLSAEKFDTTHLRKQLPLITSILKRLIAERRWGPKEAALTSMETDDQIQQAISHIVDAAVLISRK